MTLSNGESSPVFAGYFTKEVSDFKTLNIADSSLVRKVQGTKYEGEAIRQLIFKQQNGKEIGRIESENKHLGPEQVLKDGE